MPLFRFHRGGLEESLKTTIVVKNFNDLYTAIANEFDITASWSASIEIEPYPAENNFDARIGWHTHLVTANIYDKEKYVPVGYLSELLSPAVLYFKNDLILTFNEQPPKEDGSFTILVEQRSGDFLPISKGSPFMLNLGGTE